MELETLLLTVIIIVNQIYCIVLSVNILSNKVFTKRFVFFAGTILGVCGTVLFFYVEYYSLVFIAGILALALRTKNKHWLVCIVTPLLTFLLLVVITYLMDTFLIGLLRLDDRTWDYGILTSSILTSILYGVVLLILTYAVSTGVSRLIRNTSYRAVINKNVYLFSSILIITVIIIYSFIYVESLYQFPNEIIFFNGILFITLLTMIVVTTAILAKIHQRRVEIEKQEIEQEQLAKYTVALEKLSDEMSDFRHDYINILASLHGYIVASEKELLEEYFKSTIKPLLKNNN
ncbi:hypothetical protein DUK53_14640 [Listeria sp. SHR_NRA_18]|uniref:hypothetical protein n=1 Tax=Listeria TaxID=1637 RepID=UPI00051CDF7C|nr:MULTISPECIES: hypothetical protein [Listeria]KGL43740.1 hypothetical protein EP56_08025 [Listeriaceae bacterium FSL A5-0209]KMT61756.1 accessory regulator protein C [Listeria newyorkensis]RQW65848.1 hypothetical protein DUK53_14640 [Listeria sp. SHR_NRA_18]